jgi:hypothetical protein
MGACDTDEHPGAADTDKQLLNDYRMIGGVMYFIERRFHVSPDGGSGAPEVLLIAGLPILVMLRFRRSYILVLFRRYANRLRRREHRAV